MYVVGGGKFRRHAYGGGVILHSSFLAGQLVEELKCVVALYVCQCVGVPNPAWRKGLVRCVRFLVDTFSLFGWGHRASKVKSS